MTLPYVESPLADNGFHKATFSTKACASAAHHYQGHITSQPVATGLERDFLTPLMNWF